MGFLAPIYALAALAVAAPILLHLIRRQPTGQSEFSSLMFLQPSPPRLTRRSRLDNLWLLLLRSLALILIALAFARPFWRTAVTAESALAGRQVVLLIDTSASMQREGVWPELQKVASEVLGDLGPQDRVAVAAFDSQLRVLVPLAADGPEENSRSPGDSQLLLARRAVEGLEPGWRKGELAEALIAAAELFSSAGEAAILRPAGADTARETRDPDRSAYPRSAEIVLLSDLHETSSLDALQGFDWPPSVRLDARRIAAKKTGNARASLVATGTSGADEVGEPTTDDTAGGLRVRVENNRTSTESSFELAWGTSAGRLPASGARMVVQVPPGQSRIVPLSARPEAADRIVLSGDAEPFDNVVLIPRVEPRRERLVFLGSQPDRPEADLFYFLSQVPLDTPVRSVAMERVDEAGLRLAARDSHTAAAVVEGAVPEGLVEPLREFCESGRAVIVVLARRLDAAPEGTRATEPGAEPDSGAGSVSGDWNGLAGLLGVSSLQISEAESGGFALLGEVDFSHPLFAPLANAKFNDFGKIRFWTHRRVQWQADATQVEGAVGGTPLRVLARFDDGTPAILHRVVGKGDVWLLSAGWQASASQLAMSSKFVPLLFGMLDPRGRNRVAETQVEVGEPLSLRDAGDGELRGSAAMRESVVRSGDSLVFELPGEVEIVEAGRSRHVVVVIPEEESRLDPLELDRFEQYRVVVGESPTLADRQEEHRQLQVRELEGRQKLWQWLLACALGILAAETLLSGRLQARP
jgi:hypothetical protein